MLSTKRSASKTIAFSGLLSLCVCATLVAVIFRGPEMPVTAETSSNGDGVTQLAPGSSSRDELAAGAKKTFTISVDQDQLLRFSVDKGDLVVTTSLYGPTGSKLLEHVSQDFETVELSFPAQVRGNYRIELQSREKSPAPRPYEIKLYPLTPVTPLSLKVSEAQQAVAHAETLRAEWKETSFRQAAELYDKAVTIWTGISDFASASHAAMKSSDVYFHLSEFQEASKRYENAETFAAKANDWLGRARALSHLGRLLVYVGNNDRAQEQLTQARRLFEQHEADRPAIAAHAHGEALSNLAEVSYSKGDFLTSSRHLESALKLLQNDRKSEAKARLFLGYIYGSTGRTEKAIEEITRARELYGATNDKVGEALALTTLTLRFVDKKDPKAIATFRETIDIFRSAGDRHSEAIALNALGESHLKLNQYASAIEYSKSAFQLYQDIGAMDGASVAAFQLAMASDSNGDRDQAVAYYERCFQLSRSAGKVRTEAHRRNLLADLYTRQGRYKEAAELLKKALNFYQTNGDLRGQTIALNAYGNVLFLLGQAAEALAVYHRALEFSEQVGEQSSLLDSLYNLARANFALDRSEVALSFIERSLKIIEDLRANVASPDFKVSYFSGVQRHYQLGMEILMRLERLRPGEGFATRAFLLSDRGRARLLFDLINESQANIREGATRELVERERELRALFQVQAEYRSSLSKRDPAELAKLDKELVQLRVNYQEVQAELRKQNPRLFSPEELVPLTLSDFQNQLDSDTIMLQYGLAGEHSYLWVITSDSLHSYELPPGDVIEEAVYDYYKAITARQQVDDEDDYQAKVKAAEEGLPENATKLSQMLLSLAAGHLKNKRLLVIAEGALQYLPFQALSVPVVEGVDPTVARETFLTQTNEIVVLPSASTLVAIRNPRKHSSSWDKLIAVIADPVFTANDERVQSKPVSTSAAQAATDNQTGVSQPSKNSTTNGGLARLVHASEEADAISAVAPWGTTMVAKGFDATRETVMSSDVGQYQVVHLATHGILDVEHPELSGMVLTSVDRNGGKMNGFMALHDIYSLNLSAELTVLSACQTALGKEIRGEGQVGLTHSFLSAGSKSVIASLWKVDDRATAFLMANFYKGTMQKGLTPAAALRAAQLKMIADKQWSAPYYWAGFVLQGEYTNHITVNRRAWLRPALVLLCLVSLISATLLILQRRKRRSPPRQFIQTEHHE